MKLFIGVLVALSFLYSNAQNRVIRLHCPDVPFVDSLFCQLLVDDLFSPTEEYDFPAFYDSTGTTCYFSIPDSVYRRYTWLTIKKKNPSQTRFGLSFRLVHRLDTTIYISGKLRGELLDTLTYHLKYEGRKSDIRIGTYDNYMIENPDTETVLSMWPLYADYQIYKDEDKEESIERYMKLIKQYPHSYSLLCRTYERFVRSASPVQLETLLNGFTDKIQNSFWGIKMRQIIQVRNGKFQNIILENSRNSMNEPIVQSLSKPTFVIFSASWCAPCHALIPLLKELYQKKKDVVDFVYVSVDRDKKGKQQWNELLKKNQIHWRSLWCPRIDIYSKYGFSGIPVSFLVHQDGSFQQLDIRNEADKAIIEMIK